MFVGRYHRPLFVLENEESEICDLFSRGGSRDIFCVVTRANEMRWSTVRACGSLDPFTEFLKVKLVTDINVKLRLLDVRSNIIITLSNEGFLSSASLSFVVVMDDEEDDVDDVCVCVWWFGGNRFPSGGGRRWRDGLRCGGGSR